MNRISDDEILSAYLDGELSADERLDVERRLQADPEARKLLGQLQAVSSAVKALAPFRLGADFSTQVLRQIEQQPITAATNPTPMTRREIGRRFLRPRALFWAAAAVIVALLASRYEQSLKPGTQHQTAQTPPAAKHLLATPDIGPLPAPTALVKAAEKGGILAQATEQKPVVAAAGSDGLLVKCYMTAAKKREFALLLARQHVFQEDLPARLADVLTRDHSTLPAEWTAAGAPTARYAEVDTEHLEALLIELDRHPELYPVVVVEPAPGASSQEAWRAYSHAYGQPAATPVKSTQPAGTKHRVVFALQLIQPKQ